MLNAFTREAIKLRILVVNGLLEHFHETRAVFRLRRRTSDNDDDNPSYANDDWIMGGPIRIGFHDSVIADAPRDHFQLAYPVFRFVTIEVLDGLLPVDLVELQFLPELRYGFQGRKLFSIMVKF